MPEIIKGIVTRDDHHAKHEHLKGKGFEAPEYMFVIKQTKIKNKKRKTK